MKDVETLVNLLKIRPRRPVIDQGALIDLQVVMSPVNIEQSVRAGMLLEFATVRKYWEEAEGSSKGRGGRIGTGIKTVNESGRWDKYLSQVNVQCAMPSKRGEARCMC